MSEEILMKVICDGRKGCGVIYNIDISKYKNYKNIKKFLCEHPCKYCNEKNRLSVSGTADDFNKYEKIFNNFQ